MPSISVLGQRPPELLDAQTNATAWRHFQALEAAADAALLAAHAHLSRSKFDGFKDGVPTDGDTIRGLNEGQVEQLDALLHASAGYAKPVSAGLPAYTAQVFRLSVLTRLAPLIRAIQLERLMQERIEQVRSADIAGPTVKPPPRRRMGV
jgi:hypothetical protein